MKRFLVVIVAVVLSVVMLASCARKFTPVIRINSENVTSIDFKKTYYTDNSADPRNYKQKSITSSDDIEQLIDWLTGLSLTKHEAIEVPIERISYVIMLNGKKDHKVIFMDDYIIYDTQAYTFNDKSDKTAVQNKYNLLGYTEVDTDLDIIR